MASAIPDPRYLVGLVCFLAQSASLSCLASRSSVSDDFPYTLSIVNDGPTVYDTPMTVSLTLTVYDTPMTVNLTLIPKNGSAIISTNNSSKTPKFFFHWIDTSGPNDCPHRITRVFSPTQLVSIYNVTYHYQFMRCPSLRSVDGTRTIGVQVFDDPDFDPRWSQPVAQSQTQVRLIEHPKYWMTVREVLFKPPWYYEGLYHLRGRVFTMACGERDPWQVMRWANATRYWTITGHDIPRGDYGYIL